MPMRILQNYKTKNAAPCDEESGIISNRANTLDNVNYNMNPPISETANFLDTTDAGTQTNRVQHGDTKAEENTSIDTYLAKEISSFASVTANTPNQTLTIEQFINDCKNGKYREQVEAIRAEACKEQRDMLKKGLPAVTIQSEVCEQRGTKFCTNNAVVCLDFDGIDNIAEAKQAVGSIEKNKMGSIL